MVQIKIGFTPGTFSSDSFTQIKIYTRIQTRKQQTFFTWKVFILIAKLSKWVKYLVAVVCVLMQQLKTLWYCFSSVICWFSLHFSAHDHCCFLPQTSTTPIQGRILPEKFCTRKTAGLFVRAGLCDLYLCCVHYINKVLILCFLGQYTAHTIHYIHPVDAGTVWPLWAICKT